MTGSTAPHPDALDHETLGDRQVRELIERYVALSGATLTEVGPHLYELTVPVADRAAFGRRSSIRLAFSVEAVQTDGEAEMAIVGGAFVEQLIEAIRLRGSLLRAGRIGPATADAVAHPALPLRVRRGQAGEARSSMEVHRVGRLTARVVIRAGTALEEHLVDSGVFDLETGVALGADVAAECDRQLETLTSEARGQEPGATPHQDLGELVNRMLGDLEARLEPQIVRLQEKAGRELAEESGRIQRYYQAMLDDMGGRGSAVPDRESRRVFEAERDRRLAEERDRHQVRAVVHPVQLTEWDVLVQRAQWPLETTTGRSGVVTAERHLAGTTAWLLACPNCGAAAPAELAVCLHDHAACDACARECSVCTEAFCRKHGIATCHVDDQPACDAHAGTCVSCLRVHCVDHSGECADGDHPACSTCLGACASCNRVVCDRHAATSNESAPRGARRFCAECVRRCEGGSNELVGPDEVTGCATCDRVVCEHHQARCAVDGQVHCSTHLRRADRSRRLVCERDRAACAYEPTAVFASDEIAECTTCGKQGCAEHTAQCVEDFAVHCRTHMAELGDRRGEMACEAHRTHCHVDGGAFSLTGTQECPVCARRACQRHMADCPTCGRRYCHAERGTNGRCLTCEQLRPMTDPTDTMLAIANALFGSAGKVKAWRSARDATHTVVETDLGWTRKGVFVFRHGADRAEKAQVASLFGTRRLM